MRIGGGVANGRPLRTVAGRQVRPTSGGVRQALFNMLRDRLPGAIFVDLFAGTGSVGLEALSHGVAQVYFVDSDRRAVEALRANMMRCQVTERAMVVMATLPQALQHLPLALQADMLFLDPPYASQLGETTLAALAGCSFLAPQGVLIWQHAAQRRVPSEVLGRPLWKSRRYGNTQLSLYASLPQSTPGLCEE